MTSKEALERLKDDIEINYLSTKHNNEKDKSNYLILLNSIEKDLDRLEKLEKVIEILKKALLLNVKEVRGSYYVLGYDNNYCMTKEEYELLKEWLEKWNYTN